MSIFEKLLRRKIPRSKEASTTALQARIAALPKWAKTPKDSVWFEFDNAVQARARLVLAREWIEGAHLVSCVMNEGNGFRCTCGRDALLKALEVPR